MTAEHGVFEVAPLDLAAVVLLFLGRAAPFQARRYVRAHLKRYGIAPTGASFQAVRVGFIQDSAYSAV